MASTQSQSFGALLRRLRTESDLIQEELAERAHLSARAISDLERGVKTKPRPYTVSQLAEALDLDPSKRAQFERVAASTFLEWQPQDRLPHGRFVGAVPDGQMVGRGVAMERVRAILDSVAEGAGHLLLLAGEHGSGKTRLLQELVLDARGRAFTVLTGNCSPSEELAGYHPILDAVALLPSSAPISGRSDTERGWKQVQRLLKDGQRGSDSPDGEC